MTRGIIILEGPDGAGKTTLARQVMERYEKETGVTPCYMHGRPRRNVWPWYVASLRRAARESLRRLVVVDRHWVSECIYGTVLRNGPAFGANARALHRHWLHLGAFYVLCAPDAEFIVGEHVGLMRGREELVKKLDHVRDIATRYVDLVKGSVVRDPQGDYVEQLSNQGGVKGHANWYHYDREREREMSPRLPKTLLELARVRFERTRENTLPWGQVTGSPTATVALVGDASKSGGISPPFLSSGPSPSYLNETLHSRVIPEGLISLVNANDFVTDEYLFNTLKPFKRVVALGGKAADRLIVVGRRPDVAVRHPKFARRFQQYGDYSHELEAAIFGRSHPSMAHIASQGAG